MNPRSAKCARAAKPLGSYMLEAEVTSYGMTEVTSHEIRSAAALRS
jgi:hypothetical protein